MVTGNIPAAAAAEGFGVVVMSQMRVIDTMGVSGALAVRYLAIRKVPQASPPRGVPEKYEQKNPWSAGPHFEKAKKKTTHSPAAC
jgi:hypothetical protein